MRCKDCEYFKVAYYPMMPFDMGLVVCSKYNLECDFSSERKLNRLTCIEETEEGKK